jgi:hypothetical protein
MLLGIAGILSTFPDISQTLLQLEVRQKTSLTVHSGQKSEESSNSFPLQGLRLATRKKEASGDKKEMLF